MSQTVLSLWAPEIKAAAESPLAILRVQAEELARLTGGMLVGEVQQWPDEEDKVKITLEIMAPELHESKFRILSVQHARLMPYPALIDAEIFRPKGFAAMIEATSPFNEGRKPDNRADDDPEFRELLKKVLHSSPIKALASSLSARVTELRTALSANATA